MHRLIVNPDTPEAWEVSLKAGLNFIGRGEENDVPILHDSVSSAHCEISIVNSRVTVKDLGSERGTFIDGQTVREGQLRNGQTVQLGEVRLRLELDSEPPIPMPAQTIVPAAVSNVCRFHRSNVARYSCPKCRFSFCDLCVNIRSEHGESHAFCRQCAVECSPVAPVRVEPGPEALSFLQLVRDAFAYPFRNDGMVLLLAGGILLLLIDGAAYLARFAFLLGLIAVIILTVFGTGFLVSFLRSIITRTASGDDRIPDWPDTSDFSGEILTPFFQLLGTALFCFAPAILLTWFAPEDASWLGWVLTVLILMGCVYFPMAFLGVAMFDSVSAVNPLLIIPSILRIAGTYFLAIVLFAGVLLLQWLTDFLLPELLNAGVLMSILLWVISRFVGLYLLVVEARMLGSIYRSKQDELGWFP